MASDDLQFELLRQLNEDPAKSQRTLAARFGVSVGKLNYCLRALVRQGLVKADNFRRSDSKLAYAYVLTPAGIEEKTRLTKAFLQRKVEEFEQMRRDIEVLRREASESPSGSVPLVESAPANEPDAMAAKSPPVPLALEDMRRP